MYTTVTIPLRHFYSQGRRLSLGVHIRWISPWGERQGVCQSSEGADGHHDQVLVVIDEEGTQAWIPLHEIVSVEVVVPEEEVGILRQIFKAIW